MEVSYVEKAIVSTSAFKLLLRIFSKHYVGLVWMTGVQVQEPTQKSLSPGWKGLKMK